MPRISRKLDFAKRLGKALRNHRPVFSALNGDDMIGAREIVLARRFRKPLVRVQAEEVPQAAAPPYEEIPARRSTC